MFPIDLKEYSHEIDAFDMQSCDKRVSEIGIEEYLSHSLVNLDCSRSAQGYRLMQTIGYPYGAEIARYLYVLENSPLTFAKNPDEFDKQYWIDKLLEQHKANLEFELEHPPVWYGGKKAKLDWENKINKPPRRRKMKEQNLSFDDNQTATNLSDKQKFAGCVNIKFNFKPKQYVHLANNLL